MADLKYRFTYDTLVKMLFVSHPDLLIRLVAAILGIDVNSITEFSITNPEIPPESIGDKFCRLDINMKINDKLANLEVQVANEGDYPERSLYYWARVYSSALKSGQPYSSLPQVIIISIVDFPLFNSEDYRSEFRPLEVTRHEPLSDRMAMLYFEVQKLPNGIDAGNELELMLSLFRAKTEEELTQLAATEVPIVKQAIGAYGEIIQSSEFREYERLRADARHNEASALAHARKETEQKVTEQWQSVVAEKDAALSEKDAALSEKDAVLSEKDAEIEMLRAQLAEFNKELESS